MPPLSTRRRKRGLVIGLGLLSAAALVAFGTSSRRPRREIDAAGKPAEVSPPDAEPETPTLWARTRELAQAVFLLATQRRPNDS